MENSSAICKAHRGNNNRDYAITLVNLADNHMALGNLAEVEIALNQANAISSATKGPELAYSSRSLGELYRQLGDTEWAEQHLSAAVEKLGVTFWSYLQDRYRDSTRFLRWEI